MYHIPQMDLGADEFSQLGPDLFLWQAYDPKAKADLFSTTLLTPAGLLIVDPIPLAQAAIDQLLHIAAPVGIIVTNSNHTRSSLDFSRRFSAPIFAHRQSLSEEKISVTEVVDGDKICAAVDVIAIDGAAPGEIALHYPSSEGTLILGDALINFAPQGFSLLPKKYCSDAKQMRRSLQKLLSIKAERMLFAHGLPILSGATARLQQLLDADPPTNPR